MKKNIKLLGIFSLAVLGATLTSCGMKKEYSGPFSNEEKLYIDGDKIIYTLNLVFRSDDAKNLEIEMRGKILELGGFVANVNETIEKDYFESYATYKVPTDKLDELESFIDTKDSLSSKTKTAENVSGEYEANETTIEALQEKLNLYNAKYLETTDFNEQLNLLDKISQIESQIARVQKSLNFMENQLKYSTVNATYRYVYEPTRKSQYVEYLADIGNSIVWALAYSAPFLLLAGVGVAIFACTKKKISK